MSEKIYYIYRHVRLDTDEVFYVGKGTANLKGKTYKSYYDRAFYAGRKRNPIWRSIFKMSRIKVEVVFQHHDEQLIYEKEKEFIKIYGRKDLHNGSLANLNDGGVFNFNGKFTEETKQKMKKSCWMNGKFGSLHPRSKKLYAYKLNGSFYKEYNSMREAEVDLNINDGAICCNLTGKAQYVKGYIFRRTYEGEQIEINIQSPLSHDAIVVFDKVSMKNLEFPSVSEASRALGITTYRITKYLIQGSEYKNYLFRYKNPERKKDLPNKIGAFCQKTHKKIGKKINQINKITNQIIKTWDSAADAARFLTNERSSSTSSISSCLAGKRKTALGFKWKLV